MKKKQWTPIRILCHPQKFQTPLMFLIVYCCRNCAPLFIEYGLRFLFKVSIAIHDKNCIIMLPSDGLFLIFDI